MIDPQLMSDLKKKTGLTKWGLYKAFSCIRKDYGPMSCEESALLYAWDRLGATKVSKHIKDREEMGRLREIRQQITQSVEGLPTSSPRKKQSKTPLITQKILRLSLGDVADPALPNSIIQDAHDMAENAYPILYIFENSIRNFINIVMSKKFGSDWWESKLEKTLKLDEIRKEVSNRMKKERGLAWHGKRGAHPIYYTDFDHLIDILKAYPAVFNKFFKNCRGKVYWLINKMDESTPSRNVIAHHNPLSPRDLDRIKGNFMDWRDHLNAIKSSLE